MIKSKQMLVDLLLQHLRFPSGCFVLVSALDPFEDIGGGGEVTFAGLLDSHNFMHDHSARETTTLQIAALDRITFPTNQGLLLRQR